MNDGSPFAMANSSEEKHDKADPTSTMPAASQQRDGLSKSGGGGRRISWVKPLGSLSPLGTPRANADVERAGSSRALKAATALGWSDGFASLPEVQMQVLAEVGRLVRAAAKKGVGAASGAQCEPPRIERLCLDHTLNLSDVLTWPNLTPWVVTETAPVATTTTRTTGHNVHFFSFLRSYWSVKYATRHTMASRSSSARRSSD